MAELNRYQKRKLAGQAKKAALLAKAAQEAKAAQGVSKWTPGIASTISSLVVYLAAWLKYPWQLMMQLIGSTKGLASE